MTILLLLLYIAVCCGIGIGLAEVLYKVAEYKARRPRP